jgi:hypothetical protein
MVVKVIESSLTKIGSPLNARRLGASSAGRDRQLRT